MPTAFDTLFAEQGAPALFEQFGESVLYLPDEGRTRLITVIVNRRQLQGLEPIRNQVGPVLVCKAFDRTAEHFEYTDLVIGDDGLTVESDRRPFADRDVGETLRISGVNGFSQGHYTIESVAAGVATLDREAGDAGSTGGVGTLGFGGVELKTLKEGRDRLNIAWRKGDKPKERTIVTVIGSNGGLTKFEVL